ncbi:hypothetical protein E2C01_029657 [Portunus trituberculatus]|uniref:Uncharacterized protein n=1 Tax=Portunus trituberculatus TaxID=210409 RepID=A0A5B7ESH4_PORTR|nr:hypothetical protein [Portunus trituberculatus]
MKFPMWDNGGRHRRSGEERSGLYSLSLIMFQGERRDHFYRGVCLEKDMASFSPWSSRVALNESV